MSFPISITWSGGMPPVAGFSQMAKAAADLDAALTASGSKFSQFGQSVSQLEAPLGGVAQGMEGLGGSLGTVEGAVGGAASGMTEFSGATGELNGVISETGGFVTEATGGITEFGGATGEATTAVGGLSTGTGEFNGVISETGGFVTTAGTGMTDLGTATTEAVTPMTDLNTATTETNTSLTESVDALGNVVPGLQDTATGSADSAQGFSDLAPKVDETNTALDSSSGLLSGVSPLLADTGVNAGDAAVTTGDFSGAMAGLGDELGPVNGGLTEGNTLVGTFGDEAETSTGQTTSLKDSLGSLAFGLTTVVGAGYGLVNSFLAIRDAGFKVEAAQLRVEKSATTLDKAVLGVGKSIQKLATDSEAPIKGMTALQTAFAAFQKLIDAGIISGPQYAEALNNLKVAADALEGSTTKDNNSIAALNIQIDQLGQKAQKADLDARKLNKAFEAQTKAMVDAGMSIATLIGGMGSMIQTITSAGAAATVLKGAFIDMGIALSQTVLPALAAIAAPIAIAIGVLVAFGAAITAIRMNLAVFDDLGVKIGEVFPQLKPLLDTARQAFINLSDAMNTSVSLILGGLDSLTGGVTKFQQDWDKFTGTLPKGTANTNLLSQGLAGAGLAFMDAGKKAQLTEGQFKIVGSSLVRLSDGAVIASGSWTTLNGTTVEYEKAAAKIPPTVAAGTAALQESTTAQDAMGAAAGATGFVIKEQSVNYSDLTNAQKLNAAATNQVFETLGEEAEARYKSFLVARQYLTVIEGITPVAGLSQAAITGMGQAHMEEAQSTFESVSAAAKYIEQHDKMFLTVARTDEEIVRHAEELKKAAKESDKGAAATAKHVTELDNLKKALADNTAELSFYANSANMANRLQLEFNNGVAEAGLALNKQQFELANNTGELTRNMELIAQGKIQEVEYGEGVLAAGKALETKTRTLAESIGKFEETNRLMTESNLLLVDLTQGYVNGEQAVLTHSEALATNIGELASWNSEATRTRAIANEVIQGWVDAETALQDMAREALNNVGAIASLRQQLEDAGGAMVRWNQGFLEGTRSALEWRLSLEGARGEAQGFRTEVINAANAVSGSMQDMSHLSTEAIQQIVEVIHGVPEAFEGILDDLEGFKDNFISILTKAGEEGVVNITENIDQLEQDLNVRFSEPLKEKLKLEADRELVMQDINTLMGALATSISNNPLKVEADTLPAQGAIQALIQKIDEAGAAGSHLQPLRQSLVDLSQVDMTNIHEFAPALARVVKEAQAAGQPFDGLMAKFQELGPLAQMGASELDSLSAAFKTMGFDLDTTTGKITDATGKVVGEWGKWGVGAKGAETDVGEAMGGIGASGDAARDAWARDMQIMFLAVDQFGKHAQVMAGTVSGAYSNLATNVHASLDRLAADLLIIIPAIAAIGPISQTMATTVSGSFSNMATNASASLNRIATLILSLSVVLNTFAALLMPAIAADIGTHLLTATTHFQTFVTTAGNLILQFTQGLNVFAAEFMPLFAEDSNNNGLLPLTDYFLVFVETSGQYILDFSDGLNTFAVEFMKAWAEDVNNNGLLPATDYFGTFATEAGRHIFELGRALNTFAVSFITAFANDILTNLTKATTAFLTFRTQAGAHIIALSQLMSQFATTIITTFSTQIASNLTRAVTAFATFRSAVTTHITGVSQVLAQFATTALRTFTTQVQTNLNQAASHFASFASAVSSNMSRAKSSMDSATSSAKALKSAIDALKSKTITITTRYVTVGRPGGLARGGSFITQSPQKVGGVSVSEFGHKELVTVTPLETPGRTPVKGLGELMGKEVEKKARRGLAQAEEEERPSTRGGKEVVMVRELPIIVTVDGREIARVVNKRIFEESDALV